MTDDEQRANDDMYFIKGMTDKQPEPSERKRIDLSDAKAVTVELVRLDTQITLLREQNAQLKNRNHTLLNDNIHAKLIIAERDAAQQLSKDMFDVLEEMYITLSSDDTCLIQCLPEKNSVYTPKEWLLKAKAAIERFKSSK